jgi:hypothetical protein
MDKRRRTLLRPLSFEGRGRIDIKMLRNQDFRTWFDLRLRRDNEQKTMDNGQWTMDKGQRTLLRSLSFEGHGTKDEELS